MAVKKKPVPVPKKPPVVPNPNKYGVGKYGVGKYGG